MLKRLITLFALIAVWATMAIAHDFEVDGIYYVVNSDGTSVSVSYKGSSWSQYSNEYSGSVTIPPTVTYSERTFPVTSIGGYAFNRCSGLTSIEIPNSVTSIGSSAFSGCSGLTSATIGNSVTSIGSSAFSGCNGLTNLIWNAKNCSSMGDMPKSNISTVTIGNEVEILPDNFLNGSKITEITIPNSVTSINNSAFRDCSGLTSIEIPNSVTSIGYNAFYNCSGLTKVEISDLVAWCGIKFENAEANPLCDAHHLYLNGNEIKDLVIPNSVTSIGSDTFHGCSGLTSVTIHNSVTEIGHGAFNSCSGITSVVIPNSVTWIGIWAFWSCSGLTSVTIGNSVTSIGEKAFYGCSGLTSVTIPNSVTFIGQQAFAGCTDLGNIYSYPNPANVTLRDNVFSDVPKFTCVLHVTPEHFEAYKNASQWKAFFNIIDDLAGVEGVEVDAAKKEVEGYYDLKGIRLNEPACGQAVIVRYKDGTAKKVVVK